MDPSAAPTADAGNRAILTAISSRAFEHPADRAALTALRSVPGVDQPLRLASGMLASGSTAWRTSPRRCGSARASSVT